MHANTAHSVDHLIDFPLDEQRQSMMMAVADPEWFDGCYQSMRDEFPAFAEFLDFVKEDSGVCEERLVWYRVFAAVETERLKGSSRTLKAIARMPSPLDRPLRRFEGGGKACTFYLSQLAEIVRSA